MLRSSTLTRGSPTIPSKRPSVKRSTNAATSASVNAARFGDAGDLRLGEFRRDVRVEARAGSGCAIGGDRRGDAGCLQPLDIRLHALGQRRRCRAEIGAGRSGGIVGRVRGDRRSRPEIAVGDEILPDQRRADDHVAVADQAAIGLRRKSNLGDAGDGQRIDQPGEQNEEDRQNDRGAKLSEHDYTRCERRNGDVDELDAGERQDEAAQAVDEQIAAQQRGGADRPVGRRLSAPAGSARR